MATLARWQAAALVGFAVFLAGTILYVLTRPSAEDELRMEIAAQFDEGLASVDPDDLPPGYSVCMAGLVIDFSSEDDLAEAIELGGPQGAQELVESSGRRSLTYDDTKLREQFGGILECNGGVDAWVDSAYGLDESGPEPVAADPAFLQCLKESLTLSNILDLTTVPNPVPSEAFSLQDRRDLEDRCSTG